MESTHGALLIVGLNVIWSISSYAVPLTDLKNSWEQNVLAPIVMSACSPSGRCWGWLPVPEVRDDAFDAPDDLAASRLQARRQVGDARIESIDPWRGDQLGLNTEARVPMSKARQQPAGRITKKDVFMSRGWGAGGMPFSVLYMTPHGPRSSHGNGQTGTSQQQDAERAESSTSTLEQSNYRIALRNNASGQPRRQYSRIPQLFVSYGWGPLGK